MENEEILRIVLLCGLCEVEGACDHCPLVDYHDLVVGYGMFIIDVSGNPGIGQKGG